jgi:hypothetical protein
LQGIQGEQGLQGEQGIQGEQGPAGEQGIQGIQGEQGIQGIQGETGPAGPAGADGIDGTNGIDGVDGEDARFTISETPPENPQLADVWYSSVSGRQFIYYDNYWVESTTAIVGQTGGTSGIIDGGNANSVYEV